MPPSPSAQSALPAPFLFLAATRVRAVFTKFHLPRLAPLASLSALSLLGHHALATRLVDCSFEPEESKRASFVHLKGLWTELDWQDNQWASYGASGIEVRKESPNGAGLSSHFAIFGNVGETLEVTLKGGAQSVGNIEFHCAPLSSINDCFIRLEYEANGVWQELLKTHVEFNPKRPIPDYSKQSVALNRAGVTRLRWVLAERTKGGVCLDEIVVADFPESKDTSPAKPRIKDAIPWKVNAPIMDVQKNIYRRSEKKAAAPLVTAKYIGPLLEREEIWSTEVRDDVPEKKKSRLSLDNGKTWSEFAPLPEVPKFAKGVEVLEYPAFCTEYDARAKVLLSIDLRQMHVGKLWANYSYSRVSKDLGKTWSEPQQLVYEPGEKFDPENPLNPGFFKNNHGYTGNNVLLHSNGTVLHFLGCANTPEDPKNETRMFKQGSVCMIGTWNAAAADYTWQAGARTILSGKRSGRGALEPECAELADGRVLVVWRGSNGSWDGSKETTEPGRKWYSISKDGGRTLSPIEPWGYDDGSLFYSPSSYHRMLRHSVNHKLYWLGNICAASPNGNNPRYPLILAEVDELSGRLKRDTVMAIDDRVEGQGREVQFSNFSFFEDRETHHLEIYLTAYSEIEGEDWRTSNCYKYTLKPR